MKKFEGYLLCTDMDGTLLNDERCISEENAKAIDYFMQEGGLFTLATGRTPIAITPFFTELMPNVPIVTHNGAAVYDLKNDKYILTMPLDNKAVEVFEYVEKTFDFVGFEIYCHSEIYFYKENESVKWHMGVENLKQNTKDYRDIKDTWTKAMFVQNKEETKILREHLMSTKYWNEYSFVKSSSIFLELLSGEASKGNALSKMKKTLDNKIHTTVCVGDNENDISLLQAGDISFAVENAIDDLKKVAHRITVKNSEHAIAKIIEGL